MGDKPIQKIIEELRVEIEKAQAQAVTLAKFEDPDADPEVVEITPLPRWRTSKPCSSKFLPRGNSSSSIPPSLAHGWSKTSTGTKVAVTFDRAVLDANSPEVRLLTYGDPLFGEILARAGVRP
jgi:hypothetical protein